MVDVIQVRRYFDYRDRNGPVNEIWRQVSQKLPLIKLMKNRDRRLAMMRVVEPDCSCICSNHNGVITTLWCRIWQSFHHWCFLFFIFSILYISVIDGFTFFLLEKNDEFPLYNIYLFPWSLRYTWNCYSFHWWTFHLWVSFIWNGKLTFCAVADTGWENWRWLLSDLGKIE